MKAQRLKIFIGYDSRMPDSYAVTARSIIDHSPAASITPLVLPHLRATGLYTRPTTLVDGGLFDEISEAPMSTEFAISRFLVPHLSGFKGMSIFVDGDFLFRDDIKNLVRAAQLAPKKAIHVVKHEYVANETTKMHGQAQQNYHRKNWSSLIVFNNENPALQFLTPDAVNCATGRALHGFGWLDDKEIGGLNADWNWLEGHSALRQGIKAVHFTRGTPDIPGYENAPFADEWRAVKGRIA